MRAHIIKDGVVANTIEVESLDFMPGLIDASNGGSVGDSWDGATFAKPAPAVPQSVDRRQGKQALAMAGKLASVQPAITAIADATKRELTQIWWDDSPNFERANPVLIEIGMAIGLSSADIDQLFIAAATL